MATTATSSAEQVEQALLDRIVVNPAVLVGKPVVRGTRLSVELLLSCLGHGQTIEEIMDAYPRLTREDLQACMLFAAKALEDITYIPATVSAE